MSLLMDALKKAEEEKKRAAKRLIEQPDVDPREETDPGHSIENNQELPDGETIKPEQFSQTIKLSLEPTSESQTDLSIPTKDNQDIAIGEDNAKPEQFSQTIKLSLEPTSESQTDLSVSTEDKQDMAALDITKENLSINADADDKEVLAMGGSVTPETFDKAQEVESLNDTTTVSEGLNEEEVLAPFDDTLHAEEQHTADVYEETLSEMTSDKLVEDLNVDAYKLTPAVARTVFSTTKPSHNRNSFKWVLFFALIILVVGSYSIFYYFSTTPISRNMPSPIVAQDVESTNVALAPNDIVAGTGMNEELSVTGRQTGNVEESDTAKVAGLAQINKQIIEEFDIRNATTVVDNKPDLTLSQVTDEETGIQADDKTTVDKDVENKPEQPQEENVDVASMNKTDPVIPEVIPEENVNIDAPPSLARQSDTLFSESKLLDVSKNKAMKKQEAIIKEAFKAYQAGQYLDAKPLYQTVLKDDPDNRDAHLGAAAIAINENDYDTAYSHYSYLLKLNPDDVLTLNALIALFGSHDLVADESAIKILLTKKPDAPYLYFSLGNIYAKQKRWSEAQQAFFHAYQLDSSNAAYALNLAISLDKLGEYSTALDYYKISLDLAQASSTRFDVNSVKKRALTLDKPSDLKLQ